MNNKVIITGIRGQDGTLLASLLLDRGYDVYGLDRRSGDGSYWRLREEGIFEKVKIVHADICEFYAVRRAIAEIRPSMVFNLAAQSFVAASFQNPYVTIDVNQKGVLNILEAVREVDPTIRVYQASTSELFGVPLEVPQKETTPFYPRSPYGISKLGAHWMTINYRESYNIPCCCGILFNHESEYRGEEFVTRKITRGVAEIVTGIRKEPIVVGNIFSKRDWGYARDYVEAMFLMLTAEKQKEYVVATGKSYSVQDFITMAFEAADTPIVWEFNERWIAASRKHGIVVATSKEFERPAEVSHLEGDSSKIREELKWQPSHSIQDIVSIMVQADMRRIYEKR